MAGPTVSMGALTQCMFGAAPTPLVVLPISMTMADVMPAATILAIAPIVNIVPFGICNAPTNPMVIAAKIVGADAPCIPIPAGPWIPTAPNVMMGMQPVLTADSMIFCAWAGMINISFPGEINVIST